MGKLKDDLHQHKRGCDAPSAPICAQCSVFGEASIESKTQNDTHNQSHRNPQTSAEEDAEDLKEIVIIGSGPHSLSLVLRLLEPEADLMSEKERHLRADFVPKMQPIQNVKRHVEIVARGNTARLLKKKKRKSKSIDESNKDSVPPPCLDLADVRKSVLVVDKSTPISSRHAGWLSQWKQNFAAIEIPILRSPMSAHADPYDHRSLEFFARFKGRLKDLVTLKYSVSVTAQVK